MSGAFCATGELLPTVPAHASLINQWHLYEIVLLRLDFNWV